MFLEEGHKEVNMSSDPGATELDSSWSPCSDEPARTSDHQIQDPEVDPVLVWAPSGRRLISGLLGLNVVLLGAALVAGQAFNPKDLKHQEPQVFMLLLMGVGLVWMMWYLLWARKQPGICPHKDHHAGGITVTCEPLCFLSFTCQTTCVLGGVTNICALCSGPPPVRCLQSAAVRLQGRLSDQHEGV